MIDYLVSGLPALAALIAILLAFFLALWVYKNDEGTEVMSEIAKKIRIGANAYLKRQYSTVVAFFVVMFVLLLALSFMKNSSGAEYINKFVPFAFLSGGFFSGLSGFIGMKIATFANVRTANGARKSLNKGLRVAFLSGTVMGLTVVGLGLLDISIWYVILKAAFPVVVSAATTEYWRDWAIAAQKSASDISACMLTFGMGASSMALFSRVGGGIFTKAADVGADIVGKVEAGIPEDDPRNPAVIADNVGDNVGDVAGMGADLYESYVGSIVSAGALATGAGLGFRGLTFPMLLAAIGIIASILGTCFVRTEETAGQRTLLKSLRRGVYVSSCLVAIASWFLVSNFLPENSGIFWGVLSGLVSGVLIGFFTEYYTSDTYKPTKRLAECSKTGAGPVIINGLSLGMLSTAAPVVIIGISVLVSYFVGGGGDFKMGLYSVGVSAVGMLSTLGITLATDAYGPVADNAGGIAEMAGLDLEVRKRTDALDSLGNTTAATGKGFAIGSAALTALALIAAYANEVEKIGVQLNLSIMNPPVLIGLFLGAMLPFLFSAFTMAAVGRAAEQIVAEVRRQFRTINGLMEGKAEADYGACVDICTRSSLKEMILPAAVGVASSLVIGLILGPNGVVGMLAGALVAGFVLAIMMANSGGAWDNAKKYIESGNFGGKGSEGHKSAVVGDTVGDPFKDTSGPAVNILIKLLSIISIVFAAVVASHSLIK